MTEDDVLQLAAEHGFMVGCYKTKRRMVGFVDAVLEYAARVADQRGDVPVYPGWEVTTSVRCRKSEARIIAARIRDQKVGK